MSLLRKMFGPSQEEIWRKLCTAIDGQYVEGGFWSGAKVQAGHGEWTMTLDTYAVSTGKTTMVFTRMRAPYVNPGGFRFNIYRRGFLSGVAKWFGMQDIDVGDEAFDRDFIIKGTSVTQVRSLLGSKRLRELLAAQPAIQFQVKDDEGWFGPDFGEKVDELVFVCGGIVKDVDRLKLLYFLFAETLDQLCRIGAAYEDGPAVKL